MVKRLYLCRHGQTEFNIKGLAQGRCDSPLTELGVKQALNARDYFIKNKIEYMIMEVSSQALKYDRVNDIIFDYGVFTNLTKDHISNDEHKDMNDYIRSKAKLFSQCNYGIFNMDSKYFYDMVMLGDASINTYGYNLKADLRAKDIKLIRDGHYVGIELTTEGMVNDTFKISMPGKFSSYNAMAASSL